MSNRQQNQISFISEFCTELAYVPWVKNVVADALSGQFHDETAIVSTIAHHLADTDLQLLAEGKMMDDDCRAASTTTSLQIEEVAFPRITWKILCNVPCSSQEFSCHGPGRNRFFEQCTASRILLKKSTLAIARRCYVWQGIRKDILAWVRSCKVCARSKVTGHVKPAIEQIPVPKDRFEHVHVDLVGPFPAEQGYCYLFTAIECSTCWAEAWPLRDSKISTTIPVRRGLNFSWPEQT